ncbi:uncharacterized protein DUF3618 [Promicromonospora sp. AC04]|uniref:DUF3618 domain-containing protein n=1 Tax=Promicromonospora sp. AC04 TaxID=2135723 RepID=UPI000D35EC11|nr:DUF3618 domain-containing protein [Promicromonospora sp. AC04]PUB23948.1 uncharacterized protein DUF3618 [Promicromonospora sp. AC04]
MSTPTPPPNSRELEAEVLRTRADLAATIDELTTRLSPGYQASRIAREAKQAASDVGAMATGAFGDKNGPAQDPRRARNAKVLIGATLVVAIGTAVVVTAVLRRARG